MGRSHTAGSTFRATGGPAKILQFSVTYPNQQTAEPRQSWSRRAGVTDAERLTALSFGALITPVVWAGHSLLVWMHVL